MIHDDLDCTLAREQLSAHLDGELPETAALRAHLALCPDCAAHQRALAELAGSFAGLRRSTPTVDLWPRIELRTRPRPMAFVLARLAAALIGFASLGGAVLLVEGSGARSTDARDPAHVLERLASRATRPEVLFSALPEYRLLRGLPTREETR